MKRIRYYLKCFKWEKYKTNLIILIPTIELYKSSFIVDPCIKGTRKYILLTLQFLKYRVRVFRYTTPEYTSMDVPEPNW